MEAVIFHKNYLKTLKDLFSQSGRISALRRQLKGSAEADKIAPDLAEKIMLAVTGVNNCVYCSYLHTRTALEKGVTSEEVRQILNGEFGELPENEQVALLYAQHWAEQQGEPSEAARRRVIGYFGMNRTLYMELYMHIVNIGNLVSNTVEAHKKGVHPDTGRVRFFFVWLLCLPIAFYIRRGGRKYRDTVKNTVPYLEKFEF
ncbi:MAG: carboxymuconolactone decarboxylase family protein [Bacteroidetes bacterium]|nr:carboxymuconolactone decarboxylase family protein [Bacteroidota bacterium]